MHFKPGRQSHKSRGARWTVSGWTTPALLALLCAGLLIAAFERGHGNLHKIKEAVETPPPPEPEAVQGPGGQGAVRLSRTPTAVGTEPELLSAVFLPGRGMSLLQLTASVPGHGEVPLLLAPSLDAATAELTGQGADAHGSLSATFGGAFLLPWAGELGAGPRGGGSTSWQGQPLGVPATDPGEATPVPGYFLLRGADEIHTSVQPDGQSVETLFHAGSFDNRWPSTADVRIAAELSGHALELTVTLKNTGPTALPIGFGWKPFFALPADDRRNVLLTLPSDTVLATDRRSGTPTGTTESTDGTPRDFAHARGTPLGATELDNTFVDLRGGVLDNAPLAEFRVPSLDYGVRVLPLTANFANFRVIAPADKPWLVLEPATNADDPLGHQWGTRPELGLQAVPPGGSVQWKIRVELFSLSHSDSAALD